jgi:hypothetical protein
MSHALRFVLAAAFVPLLGCANGDPVAPPEPQDVAGLWTGTITFQVRTAPGVGFGAPDEGRLDAVELVLTEDAAGQVTGAGALFASRAQVGLQPTFGVPGPAAQALEVRGSNVFPTVVLTLHMGTGLLQPEFVYLRGEFVGVDTIEGRLIGGGFNNDRLRLRRVPASLVLR